jgi:nucleoid-associated protein YgaU
MVNYDAAKHEAYFRAAWKNAVNLCVMLCLWFEIPVQNIIGHFEGWKMGIANSHADPSHWFPRHGESMVSFRAAVGTALAGKANFPPPPSVAKHMRYTVQPGDTLWAIARDRLGTGTRYTDIMALNNMGSSMIRAGQVLLLPE